MAKDRVRQGVSSLLDGITNVLTIKPESDDDDHVINHNHSIFDRSKVKLLLLNSLAIIM